MIHRLRNWPSVVAAATVGGLLWLGLDLIDAHFGSAASLAASFTIAVLGLIASYRLSRRK